MLLRTEHAEHSGCKRVIWSLCKLLINEKTLQSTP
uniref:Uncharacterized protein n=1 Tax=Anguilla anguilla TaxID=7936 RepID=A0A0E9QPU2_ANGAN